MVGDNDKSRPSGEGSLPRKPSVSVVIPTLNECGRIGKVIETCWREGADEIIVVDGGSTDGTVVAVRNCESVKIAEVHPAQRARQMNRGAELAGSEWLVFLHADSLFDVGSLAALRRTVAGGRVVGGGFRRRYRSSSRLLAASCLLGNLRARCLGWFLGDQAIWVSRQVFLEMGGFPEVPRFEDLDFSRRLARMGSTSLVRPGIMTSARRFKGGVASRIAKDAWLTFRHLCKHPSPQG